MPSTTTKIRFTAVGHVTNDRLASGLAAGGSALYAALAARALGAEARVLTSHGPDFVGGPLLDGIAIDVVPAARTTTFENVYDAAGRRRARVTATAAHLGRPDVDADLVFVCPVVDEVDPIPGAAVGLQGWLRAVDDGGLARPRPLGDAARFAGCRAAFVSEEDLAADDEPRAVAALRAHVPLVVVTRGAAGADIHHGDGVHHVPAAPADVVDPTGAGDVFATAFLIALRRGETITTAGTYAARAAAVVIAGVGPSALSRLPLIHSLQLQGR